jgi:hypothetical protein
VAYLDESFAYESANTFYIVAVAVIDSHQLRDTRQQLKQFYGGEALHAAPMFARGEVQTLRLATSLASTLHDGMDVVVCAPIDSADRYGDLARARCLRFATHKIHNDFGTELFVLDALSTPTQETLDRRTFSDLRKEAILSRNAVMHHCKPSREPLLGLPDILAWSYRQEHARSDRSWFDPFRSNTEVTVL